MLVSFDHEKKKAQLVLSGEELLETLVRKGGKDEPKAS